MSPDAVRKASVYRARRIKHPFFPDTSNGNVAESFVLKRVFWIYFVVEIVLEEVEVVLDVVDDVVVLVTDEVVELVHVVVDVVIEPDVIPVLSDCELSLI